MADWTAITGIVVSGVVGPSLGATYAARRLNREHASSRVLGDLAELRSLLDDAEQAVRRATRWAASMQGLFMTHGRWLRERANEQYEVLRESAREVDRQAGRITLRRGTEDPMTCAYDRAFQGLTTVVDAIGLAGDLGDDADLKETHSRIREGIDQASTAHADFTKLASDLVASQLVLRRPRGGRRRRRSDPLPVDG